MQKYSSIWRNWLIYKSKKYNADGKIVAIQEKNSRDVLDANQYVIRKITQIVRYFTFSQTPDESLIQLVFYRVLFLPLSAQSHVHACVYQNVRLSLSSRAQRSAPLSSPGDLCRSTRIKPELNFLIDKVSINS